MPLVRASIAFAVCAAGALSAQPVIPIENDQVRVLVVTDPPHRKSALHEHKINRVMIYLDAGHQKITYSDGRADDIQAKAGDVRWSAADGMHRSENVGGAAYRLVEVELKNSGRSIQLPALDPVKVAPETYKILFENPQVRVLRARAGARQKLPLHEHTPNRVVVFLTDMRVLASEDGRQPAEVNAKAGEVRWAGAARHMEENLADKPFEVVVVELR